MARPTPVFGSLLQMVETAEAPQHVRVFENGRFLYASFDFGREQIMDLRAHDRVDLLQYWLEWMKPAPAVAPQHERTPERPAKPSSEPLGEFLTSIVAKPRVPQRRMTLEEFLVG